MSGPIQNNPDVKYIVPNPQSEKKEDGVLTKVADLAMGALGSFHPHTLPLDPSRVELAVSKSFKWLWDFEEENGQLIWETEASESDIRSANEEQYPVLQPTYKFLKDLFLTAEGKDSVDFLKTMGFSYEVGEFKTPTREQLVINYNGYQKKHPEFPKLVFRLVDEILEPDEFISSVLETDFILSDGQELIHDYTYHTIPTLIGIFQAHKSYRSYKDLLGQSVKTFLKFLNQEPMEILTQLNEHLKTPIKDSDIIDIIATLKYMVGAALDVLTGQIFDYEKILKKGDAWDVVNLKFFKYLWYALIDKRWESNLADSVPPLKQDIFKNYSLEERYNIVDTIFTVKGSIRGD